eukprot:tig00000076_g2346.t1
MAPAPRISVQSLDATGKQFAVEVKTAGEGGETSSIVSRRDREFTALQKLLSESHPDCAVPVIAGGLIDTVSTILSGDVPLAERRRRSLQAFLDKISRHPRLSQSELFRSFCSSATEGVFGGEEAKKSPGAAFLGRIAAAASAEFQEVKKDLKELQTASSKLVKGPSGRLTELGANVELLKERDSLLEMEHHLSAVLRCAERAVVARNEYAEEMLNLSKAVAALAGTSAAEGPAPLSKDRLEAYGQSAEALARSLRKQSQEEEEQLVEVLSDVLSNVAPSKTLLRRHDEMLMEYDAAAARFEGAVRDRQRADGSPAPPPLDNGPEGSGAAPGSPAGAGKARALFSRVKAAVPAALPALPGRQVDRSPAALDRAIVAAQAELEAARRRYEALALGVASEVERERSIRAHEVPPTSTLSMLARRLLAFLGRVLGFFYELSKLSFILGRHELERILALLSLNFQAVVAALRDSAALHAAACGAGAAAWQPLSARLADDEDSLIGSRPPSAPPPASAQASSSGPRASPAAAAAAAGSSKASAEAAAPSPSGAALATQLAQTFTPAVKGKPRSGSSSSPAVGGPADRASPAAAAPAGAGAKAAEKSGTPTPAAAPAAAKPSASPKTGAAPSPAPASPATAPAAPAAAGAGAKDEEDEQWKL